MRDSCGNCVYFWIIDRTKKLGYCTNPDSERENVVMFERMCSCSGWEGK